MTSPKPSSCPLQCPDQLSTDDMVREAILNLSQGEPDSADNLLSCAMERDSSHKRANKMQQQLNLSPQEYFGTARTSNYRIVESDTLATIAQRCLRDSDKFLALARLNGIRDPRSIQIGQIIRIPGQRSCVDVSLLNAEARDEFSAGNLENAYKKISEAKQNRNNEETNQLHSEIALAYIEELHQKATALNYNGDCPMARTLWNQILKIDSNDEEAKLYLERVICQD